MHRTLFASKLVAAALSLAALTLARPSAAASYSIVDLGTLGGPESTASAINNKGHVTGGADFPYPEVSYAFLYSDGVMQFLGLPLNHTYSNESRISINDSDVIAASLGSTGEIYYNGWSGLQKNYGGINNKSQVTGAADTAFLIDLTTSGFKDLGTLPGFEKSVGVAVNDNAEVTGFVSTVIGQVANVHHAFLYSNAIMKDLGTLGGPNSSGAAINIQGNVVGKAETASGRRDAFLYSNGVMTDLNTLLLPAARQAWVLAEATGINDRGQIVGNGFHNGNRRGFLLTPLSPVPFDFNDDGYADLLFQSQSTGNVGYITFNGLAYLGSGYISQDVGLDYKVVAAASFIGNVTPDIIYQSQATGNVGYAAQNGLIPTGVTGVLFLGVAKGFQVVGTPDLNGDGVSDVLFQNQAAGDLYYTFMMGTTPGASDYLFRGLDPNLKLVGTPDLNGDGHPDLLFENMKTGDVVYALMNGTTPISYGTLFQNVPLEYQIVGTPDLNGDGQADILFQGRTTGDVSYVLLNGLNVTSFGYLFRGLNLDFKIVGIH